MEGSDFYVQNCEKLKLHYYVYLVKLKKSVFSFKRYSKILFCECLNL